ncbi:MAG TPA: SUF system Fe-S cluster assembly regulator [Planctomycetes bacterium]|nr:SUF system Fe-S cluster assembly regulator [Planctomycetota bacterium]
MLRITKQTDYGILLLTHLAASGPTERLSTKDLADRTRLPLPTVSKALKVLVRAGILRSHRGVQGGYELSAPPREITLDVLVAALEGPVAMTECSDAAGGDCRLEGQCHVQVNWQRINEAVQHALSQVTLAEMVQPFPSLVGLASQASRIPSPPGPQHEKDAS